jgi:uncharacterized membrane protein YdbT with pleckstrin-like domain
VVSLDQVRGLDRPDRALFTVYLVRSVGTAIGVLLALGFIALRIADWQKIVDAARKLAAEGLPIVALVLLAFLVCYGISAFAFYVRYRTLRYRFDEDGLTRQWGLLFRRESFLAYKRIQDAQVTQGIVERFLGIGTVSIQTASGSKGYDESIEGMRSFELVRDFLYERMRGASVSPAKAANVPEEVALVGEVRDAVRALREAVTHVREGKA